MLQYLKILHMIDFLKSRDLTFFNKTHKVCKNSTKKGYKTNSSSYNRSLYGISLNKVLYFREIFLSCLDVRYSGLTVKLVFRSQTVINMFVRHYFFKSAPHCLNLWFVDGKIRTRNEHTFLKVQQRVVSSCETHTEDFKTNPKWPSQSQLNDVQAFHQDFPNHEAVMVFVTEFRSPHFTFRSTFNLSCLA